MNALYWLWMVLWHKIIMLPFLRFFIGGEYYGSENLNLAKQYILVANHSSHVDTVTILSALPWKSVHKLQPIAAKDYFGRNAFIAFISKLFINTLLIDRNKSSNSYENSIGKMTESLDKKNNLLIFPEGSRITDDTVKEFKIGIVKVLKSRPEIPYIPVALTSSAKVLAKGDPFVVPHNYKIFFGKPLYYQKDLSEEENLKLIRDEVIKQQSYGL